MGKGEGQPRDPQAPVSSVKSPGVLGNRGFLPARRTQPCQPSPGRLGASSAQAWRRQW